MASRHDREKYRRRYELHRRKRYPAIFTERGVINRYGIKRVAK